MRELLARHQIAPAKARGQSFVADPNTVRKMVRDAGVGAGELVVEIGPGLGSLTLALRAAGARVVAIEVDAGLVRVLQTEVCAADPGVQVVHADALEVDYRGLLGGQRAALVANLPYNVATPLVFHALEAGCFTRLHVMVQREVGERWAARVGQERYGAVSLKLAAHAEVERVARVSAAAFVPTPNVESVTVRLEPRPWPYAVDRAVVCRLVDAGFAQRRKRLRNALAAIGHEPAAVEQALVRTGRDAGARAEELDLAAWVALAGTLEP